MRHCRGYSVNVRFLAGVLIAARCSACVSVYPNFNAGPEFRVRIDMHGQRADGVRVELGPSYSASTNRDVIALFRDVAPGSYFVSTGHGLSGGAGVTVTRDGPQGVIVPLTWPATKPLVARSLRGVLRGPGYSSEAPQRKLLLDLLEAFSGKVLMSTETDGRGEFQFADTPPGLYFIRLSELNGSIPVALEPGSGLDRLDVEFGSTSCGFAYADRTKCPHVDLHIARLRGQVVDSEGAGLQRAEILLFRGSETAARIIADPNGGFDSSLKLAGTFDVLVRMAGFAPLRTSLTVDERAENLALRVQLGLLFAGSCSYAKVQ